MLEGASKGWQYVPPPHSVKGLTIKSQSTRLGHYVQVINSIVTSGRGRDESVGHYNTTIHNHTQHHRKSMDVLTANSCKGHQTCSPSCFATSRWPSCAANISAVPPSFRPSLTSALASLAENRDAIGPVFATGWNLFTKLQLRCKLQHVAWKNENASIPSNIESYSKPSD